MDTGRVDNHCQLSLGHSGGRQSEKKDCLKSNGSKWKFAAKSGELSLWTFQELFVVVAFQLCDCSTRTLLFDTGWQVMSIACAGEPQD